MADKVRDTDFLRFDKQYVDMINFLPDPTFAVDMKKRVLLWNSAMEEMTGVRAGDIIGKDDYEYSIPFYGTRRPVLIDFVLDQDEVIAGYYPGFTRRGDAFYADVFVPVLRGGAYIWAVAKPLYGPDGTVIGAIESLRDITEHKQAELVIRRQKDELERVNKTLSDTVRQLSEANNEYETANKKLEAARAEIEQANLLLKLSEEKFAKSFKLSPMVVSLSTASDGKYVEVSDSFYTLTEYTREEVIGHSVFELNIWKDVSDRERVMSILKVKGRVRDEEISFRSKSGTIRTMLFSAELIMIAGTPYLLTINADITDRIKSGEIINMQKSELERINNELVGTVRMTEEANARLVAAQRELIDSNEKLRLSEEKFSKTFHLGPVIITLSNLEDGMYTEVSDYFLKLTGYRRDEVIGHSSVELDIWVNPADRDNMIKIVTERGGIHDAEFSFRSRSGIIYDMLYSAEPVYIAGRRHLISVAIDITERKRAEAEKDQLEKQFLQSQKMESVGRLAGGIAHDFNNLLTAILGNIEISMKKIESGHAAWHNLEIAKKAGESAAELAGRLLAFSRKQIIEPKIIDLNGLVENIEKLLVRLIGEDVNLYTTLRAARSMVMADPGQVEQVLVNLAVNSRDAMPSGGTITISTENIQLDEYYCRTHAYTFPGDYVMVSVNDTGCGMTDEVKKHLFEPFFTTKPKGRGTGLGLAMVYGAVKQNNGNIEVYSAEGTGTSFKIYLPVYTGQSGEIREAEPATGAEIYAGNGETILVVEDDDLVNDFASSVLEQLGYRVLRADSAEKALEISGEYDGEIDILLTDVILPGRNGKQLADEITALRPSLKVIYTSGYTGDFIAHHGVLDGKLHFIGKPFSAHSLSKKIREVRESG